MLQLYRVSIEFFDEAGNFKETLAEKWIKTRTLNAAKAWATNFEHRFGDEMWLYWGAIRRGWSKPKTNWHDICFVKKTYYRGESAITKVEWRPPQLSLDLQDSVDRIPTEQQDPRTNNDFVVGYLAHQIETSITSV